MTQPELNGENLLPGQILNVFATQANLSPQVKPLDAYTQFAAATSVAVQLARDYPWDPDTMDYLAEFPADTADAYTAMIHGQLGVDDSDEAIGARQQEVALRCRGIQAILQAGADPGQPPTAQETMLTYFAVTFAQETSIADTPDAEEIATSLEVLNQLVYEWVEESPTSAMAGIEEVSVMYLGAFLRALNLVNMSPQRGVILRERASRIAAEFMAPYQQQWAAPEEP